MISERKRYSFLLKAKIVKQLTKNSIHLQRETISSHSRDFKILNDVKEIETRPTKYTNIKQKRENYSKSRDK